MKPPSDGTTMEYYMHLRSQPHGDRIIAALDKVKLAELAAKIRKHRSAHPMAAKMSRVK